MPAAAGGGGAASAGEGAAGSNRGRRIRGRSVARGGVGGAGAGAAPGALAADAATSNRPFSYPSSSITPCNTLPSACGPATAGGGGHRNLPSGPRENVRNVWTERKSGCLSPAV